MGSIRRAASIKPRIEIRGNAAIAFAFDGPSIASIKPRIEIRGNAAQIGAPEVHAARFNKAANRNSRKFIARQSIVKAKRASIKPRIEIRGNLDCRSIASTTPCGGFNKAANRNSRK